MAFSQKQSAYWMSDLKVDSFSKSPLSIFSKFSVSPNEEKFGYEEIISWTVYFW
jgi:hypothetical protein